MNNRSDKIIHLLQEISQASPNEWRLEKTYGKKMAELLQSYLPQYDYASLNISKLISEALFLGRKNELCGFETYLLFESRIWCSLEKVENNRSDYLKDLNAVSPEAINSHGWIKSDWQRNWDSRILSQNDVDELLSAVADWKPETAGNKIPPQPKGKS